MNKKTGSSFPDFFKQQRGRVERTLTEILPPRNRSRLAEAMRYSTLGGGKRVRGVLLLETARVANSTPGTAPEPLSAAIELIHAYTLVHDDLPAMDDDDVRRGQPACHRQFDEATAILTGNALLSLAYRTFADLKMKDDSLALLIRRVSDRVGHHGLLEGQSLDLQFEGTKPSEDDILEMYGKKTGSLMALSMELGAIVAGIDRSTREELREVGRKLGVGFQVRDDLLEREKNSDKLGKGSRSDRRQRKSTLAGVFGTAKARQTACRYVEDARKQLNNLPYETDRLVRLAEFLIKREY